MSCSDPDLGQPQNLQYPAHSHDGNAMAGEFPHIRDCMPMNKNLYYGGRWHSPRQGQYKDTYNPANGSVIDKIAHAGAADTEAAIQAASLAFETWKITPGAQRAIVLHKAADALRHHAVELALLDSLNTGNPIKYLLKDAEIAAANMDYFAGLIPMLKGETIPQDIDHFHYTLREPLGVVARMVSFNHPIMFVAGKMAAPLAAGNTVIIKPPEQAPLSSLRLAEILTDIFPPGVFNILPGGIECGKILSSHHLVRMVTLIGSVPTGKAVMRSAAETLKPTSLELGGKNALIAFPDADIGKLIDGVSRGMNFSWAGQSCGSTSRVFLHESIHDKVLEGVVRYVKSEFKSGVPTEMATTMGPVISKAAQERILAFIESGKSEGARIVCGGGASSNRETQGGYFIEPTIFADVRPSMRIAREEIFGPVMSVFRWANETEMLRMVNGTDYGLTAAIYTGDIATAHYCIRQIDVGYIWINTVARHFLGVPFGGHKASGGGREEAFEELQSFTQTKSVNISAVR